MGNIVKIESFWGNRLLDKTQSLGNTGESILDKVSDLLNDYCKTRKLIEYVAEQAGLDPQTIVRLMERKPTEQDHEYNPQGDTMTRVLLVFGATITWGQVKIKAKYLPSPKD